MEVGRVHSLLLIRHACGRMKRVRGLVERAGNKPGLVSRHARLNLSKQR